jgi:hypothetical protein
MKILILSFLSLIIFAGCVQYNFTTGKGSSFAPPRNQYKQNINQIDLKEFDINNFKKYIAQNNEKLHAEFFKPCDVAALKKENKKNIILFWNPSCIQDQKTLSLACKLDSLNLPVVLLSTNFSAKNIKEKRKGTILENRVAYILSDNSNETNIVLSRIRNFNRELCPQCYEKKIDDVMFAKAIIIHPDSTELIYKINVDDIIKKLN